MKKLIFAVAIACVGAQFAHAEQVQNWFTGGVASSQPSANNGAWIAPTTGGEVTTNAASFTLALDYTASLDFTPVQAKAPDTNVMTRVTVCATFESGTSTLPTLTGAKTAITVSNDTYYAYANGAWVAMTGDPSDEAVNLLVEIDYKNTAARARYGIVSGTTTNYLKAVGAADDSWLALGNTPNPALISSLSFTGEGELTSVRGDVQLGVAAYAGVKYPTVQDAVNEAGTTENAKVTVLRDNNEVVELKAGSKVELDTNGKTCGGIDNKSGNPVKVDVVVDAETVEEGSGTYTNEVNVTGETTIKVTTSDTSKDAYGRVFEDGGKKYLEVLVQTSSNILNAVKFNDKAVAPASNEMYRAFLNKHCNESYTKAHTTSSEIAEALNENGVNGVAKWTSYVLDLDPNNASSKPAAVVSPTTQSTSGMVLTVPTYKATLPQSNYTVEYQLVDITADTNVVITPTQIVIPFDGDKYRVDTVIK